MIFYEKIYHYIFNIVVSQGIYGIKHTELLEPAYAIQNKGSLNMNIQIGDNIFKVNLEDNETTRILVEICLVGDSTVPERYNIIMQTKKKQKTNQRTYVQMVLFEYKGTYYQNIMKKTLKIAGIL